MTSDAEYMLELADEYVAEIAQELSHVTAQRDKLLAACKMMWECYGSNCRHDHHGYCQEHTLRTNAEGDGECEIPILRAAIAEAEAEA